MKRRLAIKEMHDWVIDMGGPKEAAKLIKEKLECSKSKAEKIAGCRYPSMITPAEQVALSGLAHKSRDTLFPLAAGPRRRVAS